MPKKKEPNVDLFQDTCKITIPKSAVASFEKKGWNKDQKEAIKDMEKKGRARLDAAIAAADKSKPDA